MTCVAGANATPPEACGGVPGYDEFVAAMRDLKHSEHAEMSEWIGRPWDPVAFDIAVANLWLSEIKV